MKPITLIPAIEDYLWIRRALGYQLRTEETQLRSFARFAEDRAHRGPLTTGIMEDWARASRRPDPYTWSRRLSVVRPFARYLRGSDGATEVPEQQIFGPAHRRLSPLVLSPDEVTRLILEAEQLYPGHGLRPLTFSTLFGLLACTGLRVSEALRLEDPDADLTAGVLQIRQSKFRKSRLVPLHASAVDALRVYVKQRDEQVPPGLSPAFFLLGAGIPVTYSRTRAAVRAVRRRLGEEFHSKLNLRCLRHTFACHRLTEWYHQGYDVQYRVHNLSTYLGHGKVTDTFWYLSGIPELLALAAERSRILAPRKGEQP